MYRLTWLNSLVAHACAQDATVPEAGSADRLERWPSAQDSYGRFKKRAKRHSKYLINAGQQDDPSECTSEP